MNKSAAGPKTALVVDDEADIRELLEITLSRMGVKTCAAADLTDHDRGRPCADRAQRHSCL